MQEVTFDVDEIRVIRVALSRYAIYLNGYVQENKADFETMVSYYKTADVLRKIYEHMGEDEKGILVY